MRLLVDANLSPVVSARLRDAGHEAIHVYDVGLAQARDEAIVEYTLAHDCVIVSADPGFGAILAGLDSSKPSFVPLRHVNEMTPINTPRCCTRISMRSRKILRPARSPRLLAERFE